MDIGINGDFKFFVGFFRSKAHGVFAIFASVTRNVASINLDVTTEENRAAAARKLFWGIIVVFIIILSSFVNIYECKDTYYFIKLQYKRFRFNINLGTLFAEKLG